MIFMIADMIEEHHLKKVRVREHESIKIWWKELASILLFTMLVLAHQLANNSHIDGGTSV